MDALIWHAFHHMQQLPAACHVLYTPSPPFPIPLNIHSHPSTSSLPLSVLSLIPMFTCYCVQGDYLEADRKRALVPLKSTVEAEVRQWRRRHDLSSLKCSIWHNLSTITTYVRMYHQCLSSNLQVTSASTQLYIDGIEIAPVKVGSNRQQTVFNHTYVALQSLCAVTALN